MKYTCELLYDVSILKSTNLKIKLGDSVSKFDAKLLPERYQKLRL